LIRLTKTLKSDWRIDSSNGEANILFVSCHPGKSDGFVIDYVRYEWNGPEWLKYVRKAPGFWESDQPFPPRSAFP
jgi:hypothetical protein